MNIYLSSSGYNLFWQTGVLKALSLDSSFWSGVNKIYGISGGSTACIYNYHLPPPEEKILFESFCQWWESFNKRKDAKNMKFIYKNGYRWINKWNYTQDIYYNDLGMKKYYFGISHWNNFKIPIDFRWHEVDMSSFKDRTRKAMLSGYAPFFIAKPDRRWLRRGIDGIFGYRENRDFPNCEDGVLEIVANNLPKSKFAKFSISQDPKGVHQLWNKNLTKMTVRNMYLKGFDDGKNFLKNYLSTNS